ncbi:bifunctional choline kinase/ethanolamine kinase EKI1 [Sugiyamaella lignohabitans]|uniref:ethanolamine kinase n=1 Tax=Sugiyamaella lignohabitans TaxID=796027 RepID=A0A167D6F4_9ASCO|nr:bifunctional choline kinase/ethanolamine kinase EKI1 [Sugiyamaella lignohabitans]ANB12540.1 bifunctional choline kinase/ethanolamine kinase EKI1 [Sugiyamaella lignohabitans]
MNKLEPVILESRRSKGSSTSNDETSSAKDSQNDTSPTLSTLSHDQPLQSYSVDTSYDPLYAMEYTLTLNQAEAAAASDPYSTVKELVLKVFSRNTTSPPQHKYTLDISELKGGITNVLLHGVYRTAGVTSPIERQFLVRAYGNGTSAIIDRDREFATHLSLYSLGLAPPLYSRFANGLIYGFIPAKSCHYTDLSDPEIIRGVSNKLAEWHVKLDRDIIQTQIIDTKRKFSSQPGRTPKFATDIWDVLSQWIETMPTGVVNVDKADLKRELVWIKETIGNVSPEVVSHCDLLSGNILVPEQWEKSDYQTISSADVSELVSSKAPYSPSQLVTFIDYEYAMPAPRGFDLANHFMEWQGFECKTELIPEPSKSNPVLRYWAFHYLSALSHFSGSSASAHVTDADIDSLIQELVSWWGMPGFYWGIWSAIQSSISDIDFDYKNYATLRLNEYYAWKKTYEKN